MTLMTLTQNEGPVSSGFRVDVSRGERVGRVSSEWFSRPDDERYLSLTDLYDAVRRRAESAQVRTVESRTVKVEAARDNAERLALLVPGCDEAVAPTHWSFGQLCGLVGAPSSYMRQLPAPLAGINLQHGLLSHRAELVKTLEADDGRVELRAVTGPDYGRIWDHELVAAVIDIAGNGTGDTRWKVPGVLDWNTMTHNPFVDITEDTTTLYASDRDVFLFLVDDTHPIEAGRLRDGSPDLYFRGFYCWNSEVGAKTLGMASFYLRAVCQNRNLWGVEDFEEIIIRHSKYASSRFAHEAAPALLNFANSSATPFVNGIKAARERIVARSDEDRTEFLRRRGFSKAETAKVIDAVLTEEGRPPESVLDYLAHSFPVQLYELFTDSEGNLCSRPVYREGQPVESREAVARRDRLVEKLASLPPVPGALDQIVQRFGADMVAEVTGRSRRIIRKGDRLMVENRAGSANLAETAAFMNDAKRILVFSDAGGTGRSYHAELSARNRRLRVHYLLEPGWKADAAIQGLGRTNRTNQAQPPLFRPIATNVKAEKRFLSPIARRLDTLGAITRGQR